VRAAHRVFPAWAQTTIAHRQEVLALMARRIEEHAQELGELLSLEQGKPLAAAVAEAHSTAGYFRFFAQESLEPEVIEDSDARRVEIHRDPLGVVGAIIPWNYPLLLLAFKLPAALLAGNTIVVKPSPTTPLATLRLGELLADLVPAGVVNIVTGGQPLGPQLTSHPLVRKVAFTGSTETGKKVMAIAAENLTRVTLELGGNDPAIVFPDVDVKATADLIFQSAFGNSGQVCRAVKRVYAHEDVVDELSAELARLADQAAVGDGMQEGVEFGPVQNGAQYGRVLELLEEASLSGRVLGGGPVEGKGYFIRPTIVVDPDEQCGLVQEEQFGPVLPVLSFTESDEVVGRANSGPYGLAASVWTRDPEVSRRVARQLVTGTVWINKHIDRTPHLPVAGAKQSGIGVELGRQGLLDFTQLKIVNSSEPVA
jgi:acyl-CoA reductase-like NAD-dependent aldehyde dehydrogenase